jgi:hypothetical protein
MEDTDIIIRWDSGALGLFLPVALEEISPSVLERKAFRVLLTEAYLPGNKGSTEFLNDYLVRWVAEHRQAWEEASLEFQHCYVDPDYRYGADKNVALANNKKLFQAVKSTKRTYNRAAGILQRWENAKKKYLT